MKTEDVGSVPVCEGRESRKLVGIVTDRDLAIQVVAAGKDPHSVKAGDVMTHEPVTCRADQDLQSAIDAMEKYQIRRIPVVDESGQLVGIIAQADVATRIDEPEKTAELVEEVSQPTASMRAG
jgi:CBS domain-containing protein